MYTDVLWGPARVMAYGKARGAPRGMLLEERGEGIRRQLIGELVRAGAVPHGRRGGHAEPRERPVRHESSRPAGHAPSAEGAARDIADAARAGPGNDGITEGKSLVVTHEEFVVEVARLNHANLGPFGEEPHDGEHPEEQHEANDDNFLRGRAEAVGVAGPVDRFIVTL